MKHIRLLNVILVLLLIGCLTACKKKKKKTLVMLSIISEPAGANVFVGKKLIGETPLKKPARPNSKFVFKFSKDGYEDSWQKIIIPKAGSTKVEAKLKQVSGSYMITSKPSGASIDFNGKVIGATPFIIRNLKPGSYSAILKKVNYEPITINWEMVDSRPQRRDVNMESNIGWLSVDSAPRNARIMIQDENRGFTPYKCEMEEGEYKVLIRKPGFADFKDTVTVERGQTKKVFGKLRVLPGGIKIASTPKGAEVYINGKRFNNTPTVVSDLKPGVYKIRIVKDGFDPDIRNIDVMAGRSLELNVVLDSNRGGIDLVVNPPGVTVYIDGKKMGITEPSDNPNFSDVFEVRNLSMGKHKVRLAHKRATPPVQEFVVKVRKGKVERPASVTMWIADTILLLKDGTKMVGRLRADNKIGKEVLFERTPGITQRYGYDEIKKLTPLAAQE